MAYGFKAFNGSNEVLIDSSTKNLFFLSKAIYMDTTTSTDYCGGSRILRYRTSVPSQRTPLPFFSYPFSANTTYVAITKIVYVATNLWEIYLLVSGTSVSATPEVYIFIEYDRLLAPSGKYGMIVYQDGSTSEVTFDSRANPLVIKSNIDMSPTSSPYISSDATVLASLGTAQYNQGAESLTNGVLVPDNSISSTITSITVTKPIFNYSSSAQAYKQYNMFTDASYRAGWLQDIFGGNAGDMQYVYFYNNYATFSRPGIKYLASGTSLTITLGWIAVSAGQYNPGVYSKRERLIGFNTTSTGMAGYTGTWKPSTSLNIRSTPITVADGSKYD